MPLIWITTNTPMRHYKCTMWNYHSLWRHNILAINCWFESTIITFLVEWKIFMREIFMSTNNCIVLAEWNIYFIGRLFIYFVRNWRICKLASIDKCLIVCDRRKRAPAVWIAKLKCMPVQMMQTPYTVTSSRVDME